MTRDVKPRFVGDHVAFDGRRDVIGVGKPEWTGSNTRYVKLSGDLLREWAELVESMTPGMGGVYVGVTPGAPIIAAPEKDPDIALVLSPKLENDEGGD